MTVRGIIFFIGIYKAYQSTVKTVGPVRTQNFETSMDTSSAERKSPPFLRASIKAQLVIYAVNVFLNRRLCSYWFYSKPTMISARGRPSIPTTFSEIVPLINCISGMLRTLRAFGYRFWFFDYLTFLEKENGLRGLRKIINDKLCVFFAYSRLQTFNRP